MSKMIFVNLPVANLPRAIAFYEAIGAEKNEQFTDETAACMVFSETIHAMLLTHDKFRQFTPKKIADARESTEVLICLSPTAVTPSTPWRPTQGLRAGSWIRVRSRITASCTAAASRTWTAISGK
jgi:hypothetical protein